MDQVTERFEELIRLSREADRIDRRRAELFEPMMKSAAWAEYQSMLKEKIERFSEQLLAPSASMDGMVASEWIKGAMSGLIMARDITSVTLATVEAMRSNGQNQAEDDDA